MNTIYLLWTVFHLFLLDSILHEQKKDILTCHKFYAWENNKLLSLFVQPIGNIAERFQALCLKDSGVLYEDPYLQVFFLSFPDVLCIKFYFNFNHIQSIHSQTSYQDL